MNRKVEGRRAGNVLLESPEAVADLLKSAASPVRIHILALLQQEKGELSGLIESTGMSKNALVNHLNLLIRMGIVRRAARGQYEITEDGRELVEAAAVVYASSSRREEEKRERLRMMYTVSSKEGDKMSTNVIGKKVEYAPCWISYTGAVAGSLKALGVDCDIVDVGGRSGYSFIINMAKGTTCPSGPTALPDQTWEIIHKATESLGFRMEHWFDNNSYPAKPGSPTPEELRKARDLFERVKEEIDKNGRPVVLWGLVQPEYGIVKGYKDDSYLVSTFRSIAEPGKPEDPVPYHELKAPGCLDAYFFREKVKRDAASSDREALERAVKFATGTVPVNKGYVAGPAALDEWARVLESVPDTAESYMGNSYDGQCYAEGREVSAEFLARLAKRHRGKQSKHLQQAAECYRKGAELMGKFTKLFPFRHEGTAKPEDRKKGAELLRNVKPLEEKAIENMRNALKDWEAA